MKTTRELEAHHIVDKNGKNTVVWKKPASPKSSKFAALKPIITPKVSEERIDDEQAISRHVSNFNAEMMELGKPLVAERAIDIAVSKCSEDEVRLLAKTLFTGDDAIRQMIFRAGARDMDFSSVLSVAAVYEPDMYEQHNANYRLLTLQHEVELAHFYLHDKNPDEGWNLAAEDEATRKQYKRFVRVYQVVADDDDDRLPPEDLMRRTLDNSRTDHEATLAILRQTPKATCEQIDFILGGGASSVSSGAL